jgi:membrane protein implicated in regulation of membrane protease activity
MLAIITDVTAMERVFIVCAALGGCLFVVRMLLMFISGMGHGDVTGTGHGDVGGAGHDVAGGDATHPGGSTDSDVSFKALSFQGLTAFFMMFGLVGWAMIRESRYSAPFSALAAAAAGVGTVWLLKFLFESAGKLQSSGTLNMANAIGREGTVYLTIRPGQVGKVQIAIQNALETLDATTEQTEEIKTGQRVKVVKLSARLLVVEKV